MQYTAVIFILTFPDFLEGLSKESADLNGSSAAKGSAPKEDDLNGSPSTIIENCVHSIRTIPTP
jgi:hypothetical protein